MAGSKSPSVRMPPHSELADGAECGGKDAAYDGHAGWTSKVMKLGRPPTAADAAVCNNRDFGTLHLSRHAGGGEGARSSVTAPTTGARRPISGGIPGKIEDADTGGRISTADGAKHFKSMTKDIRLV